MKTIKVENKEFKTKIELCKMNGSNIEEDGKEKRNTELLKIIKISIELNNKLNV